MDGTPRRSTQANRQARRQSPYARPTDPPQSTPSRLRSVLSYLSPFRSASKPQETQRRDESEGKHREDDSDDDNDREADEPANDSDRFELHGGSMPRATTSRGTSAVMEPPASPSPNQHAQRAMDTSSLPSSFSMPNIASMATPPGVGNLTQSPSISGSQWSPGNYLKGGEATEELARFFREKAEQGAESLTAIEQAGVLHLMQHAQAIPTAFTPSFASSIASSSQPPSAQAPSTSKDVSSTQYKRRRPLYVGAGYSSRRRKTISGSSGISKSQSDGSLLSLATGESANPIVEGKRRRTEEARLEDDIPVTSLDDALIQGPVTSTSASVKPPEPPAKTQISQKSTSQGSRFSGLSTPAKPSPLWQVSKADTPSPSPPRKPTSKASTGAASLVLDVISQVDAANPPPRSQVDSGKAAILNPYDNEQNPLVLASKRTSKKSKTSTSRTPRVAAKAEPAAVEKPKEKAISPLEQLERTMPVEYRKDPTSKRSKSSSSSPFSSSSPATSKATEKKQKKIEVVEILSSDAEEEDQLAEDADEEMSPAPPAMPCPVEERTKSSSNRHVRSSSSTRLGQSAPAPAPSSGFSFAAATSSSAPAPTASFNFGATTPSKLSPVLTTLPAAPSALSPPVVETPSAPKASLPPTPPPASAPFTFSLPPRPSSPAATAPSVPEKSEISPPSLSNRDRVAALPRSSLPIHQFEFAVPSPLPSQGGEASLQAVKDLVRNMSKGELPSFVF